ASRLPGPERLLVGPTGRVPETAAKCTADSLGAGSPACFATIPRCLEEWWCSPGHRPVHWGETAEEKPPLWAPSLPAPPQPAIAPVATTARSWPAPAKAPRFRLSQERNVPRRHGWQ